MHSKKKNHIQINFVLQTVAECGNQGTVFQQYTSGNEEYSGQKGAVWRQLNSNSSSSSSGELITAV